MPNATQLIERIMIDKLFGALVPLSGVEKIGQFFCALSIFLMVAGLVFLIYGAHIWLSIHYSKDMAAIITGIISLALSVIIASILFVVIHYHKIRIKKLHKKIEDKIQSSLLNLENELSEPIRNNPKTALIIASFLGFLAEEQFSEQQRKK